MIIGANTTITTYRLANSGNTAAFSGSATLSGVAAYIESLRGELAAVIGENPALEIFTCHVDPCDVKVGDKVVDAASVEYRVANIEKHDGNEDTDDLWVLTLHKQVGVYSG